MTDDNLQIILQNAIRLHKIGELDQAESCYKQILEQEPSAPNTLHYLSLLKGQQKKYAESADYAKRAIKLAPDNPHFYYTLGNALKNQKQLDEAIDQYRKALSLKKEYAEASYELGSALIAKKDYEEAANAFKQSLATNPKLVEAFTGLGIARNHQKEYRKAIYAFREALELNPNDPIAHLELARALIEERYFPAAEKSLKKVLSINENNREALYLLAEVNYETRDFDSAISNITKLINLGENNEGTSSVFNLANAYANLGVYLQIKGDFDGAEKAFLKALSLNDGNITAYLGLEEMGRFPANFNEIEKIQALIEKSDRYTKSQIGFLHVTLSRILEKQKRDDEAFEHLRIGKQLKREETQWSIEPSRRALEELTHFFTPEFIKAHEGVGNPSTAPIFIVSMPRAGSTLTEQILASHSQVFGAGELGALNGTVSNLVGVNNLDFPQVLKSLSADEFNRLGHTYLEYVKGITPANITADYFTDKLPANFRLIGFIHLILPNAKIIHCIRNPIETCLGCYKQIFRDQNLQFADDLTDVGQYYRLYHNLMEHWKTLFPGKILDVHYEKLVADQEAETRRILEFCGLPWEAQCLEYHKTDRPVFTASSVQVRKPIYSSALGRWKRYEKHLDPLLNALGPLATDYPY